MIRCRPHHRLLSFPQIADGDWYSTQFSSSGQRAASVNVDRFFGDDGVALDDRPQSMECAQIAMSGPIYSAQQRQGPGVVGELMFSG